MGTWGRCTGLQWHVHLPLDSPAINMAIAVQCFAMLSRPAALSEKGKDHVWVSTYCSLQGIQSHWQTLDIFAFLALASASNFNLICLGATQTICNAQRCQKETSGWFDDLKRSLWNPGNMLKWNLGSHAIPQKLYVRSCGNLLMVWGCPHKIFTNEHVASSV